ncbi:uncharacterized protein LOC119324149 [Triticum dicoccoides]|uniref:uncharacterized protein LOC119324149 n=1 Tax=Triticum dicoccoides TaxID=85692 RepID=UPI0018906601|nr:uncharacterized protein LOC119324149 [Triticum dicoccoides]
MVCPVLLAISLKKVDVKNEGDGFVRFSISTLVTSILEAGLLPFICLSLAKLTHTFVADFLFVASKLLIHLCALLLTVLVYGIILLIDLENLSYMLVLFPYTFAILWCYNKTRRNGRNEDAQLYTEYQQARLENSIDFAAAVTALLFLGLEGLAALELPSSSDAPPGLLVASLPLSFCTCLTGVFIMLLATVPPTTTQEESNDACNIVEVLNLGLAFAFALNVFFFTAALLGELALLVWVMPLVSFFAWIFATLFQQNVGEDVKPASMELTKVTFAGFLVVLAASSNTPVSSYASAFVLFSGAAATAGLGWRLLTHKTPAPSAMVKAADFASLFTHVYAFIAVIPFAVVASKALNSQVMS